MLFAESHLENRRNRVALKFDESSVNRRPIWMRRRTRRLSTPQVRGYTNDAWEEVGSRPLTGGVSGYPIFAESSCAAGNLYVLTIPMIWEI